jgi:hypothetical protein
MSKITRRVIASALAIGGIAALNPASAEAKSAEWLSGTNIAMAACFGAPGSAVASVTPGNGTGTYTITVSGNTGDFEYRARYGYFDARQNKMLFSKSRSTNPAGAPTTYTGSISAPRLVIYRLDVVDTTKELLVYTSDGPEGCD